jgi:hypothetical protein
MRRDLSPTAALLLLLGAVVVAILVQWHAEASCDEGGGHLELRYGKIITCVVP